MLYKLVCYIKEDSGEIIIFVGFCYVVVFKVFFYGYGFIVYGYFGEDGCFNVICVYIDKFGCVFLVVFSIEYCNKNGNFMFKFFL